MNQQAIVLFVEKVKVKERCDKFPRLTLPAGRDFDIIIIETRQVSIGPVLPDPTPKFYQVPERFISESPHQFYCFRMIRAGDGDTDIGDHA